MDEAEKKKLAIVNSSGFPLQIAVINEIKRTFNRHGWKVNIGEHRWKHPELRESGYIDIIISHNDYIFTILIECKRVREGSWVFLTPEASPPDQSRLSAFFTSQGTGQTRHVYWWSDVDLLPRSKEAEFCIMKGQDEKNPMLERVADGLLPAVEAVGLEYLTLLDPRQNYGDYRLFLPVVVTSAELTTVAYDPADTNMASGELDGGKCSFAVVPYIRFRKSLSTHYPSSISHSISKHGTGSTLERASKGNERTILVVNSLALCDTLEKLKTPAMLSESFGYNMHRIADEIRQS